MRRSRTTALSLPCRNMGRIRRRQRMLFNDEFRPADVSAFDFDVNPTGLNSAVPDSVVADDGNASGGYRRALHQIPGLPNEGAALLAEPEFSFDEAIPLATGRDLEDVGGLTLTVVEPCV